MKAVLDHIGIAVQDVEAALAFYRDALGLEVEAPEEVVTQRVRARHIPVGGPKLELLEATASDSAIAKYIEKRGPGLHHITLRVEDIRAALEQLKARGVRLVDAEPRPGAENALVAFIHPSAAHGVLVELKQPAAQGPVLEIKRLAFGDLQLTMLHDGGFRLDGGAMFGVVPRPLWEKLAPADDRHRIQLAMRPLLVEADWGRMLVDCGAGDKMAPKQADIYALVARASPRSRARRCRPHRRVHRCRAGDAPALRSLRRGDDARERRVEAAVPQRAVRRFAAPNGRMRRIRTSAIARAICRKTSCRSRRLVSCASSRGT